VRCAGVLFGDGAADFPEFFHEIMAGVDAACGIADEKLGAIGEGFLMGVEADGGGICVGISFDDWDLQSLAPALELLDGGGAEGIGGGEDDRVAALGEPECELGGGGGFASAIDADDEDHKRFPIGARGGGEEIGIELLCELAASDFDHIVGRNIPAKLAEFIDDGGAQTDADVRADEICFEFIPIDLRTIGHFIEE